MPLEYSALKDKETAFAKCPNYSLGMGSQTYFMRGMVQSGWRKFFGLRYCAVICQRCKEIIGWEKP